MTRSTLIWKIPVKWSLDAADGGRMPEGLGVASGVVEIGGVFWVRLRPGRRR